MVVKFRGSDFHFILEVSPVASVLLPFFSEIHQIFFYSACCLHRPHRRGRLTGGDVVSCSSGGICGGGTGGTEHLRKAVDK